MEKIKILHYIPGFNMGGIESRLLDWYSNIDREKIEFVLIKLNSVDNSDKLLEFQRLGGRYYNLPPLTIKSFFKYRKQLKEVIKTEKPDILHVHSLSSGIFPLRFGKKLNVKTRILHSRTTGYLPKEKNKFIKSLIKKKTSKYATDFFGCSLEAGLWGCGKKRKDEIVVLKNGIDVDKFVFSNSKRHLMRNQLGIGDYFVVGSVGRLSPQKNISFLLKTFSLFLLKRKDAFLLLVGDGSEKENIKKEVKELGIEDRVLIVGSHENVWDYYMAFDMFVCCSFYEGFGTTSIESQANGLITIVSTGFPESVVLTDHICRLELSDGAEYWSSIMLSKSRSSEHRVESAKAVEKSGYSAKKIGSTLEQFYERKCKEAK